MAFSDIGSDGVETETHHLDALAKNGLRFAQFYDAADFNNESNLRIFHFEDGVWVDRTSTLATSDVIEIEDQKGSR